MHNKFGFQILRSFLFASLSGIAAGACGSGAEADPGLVAGLYAVVVDGNNEIVSNEFEVELVDRIGESNSQPPQPQAVSARIVSSSGLAGLPDDGETPMDSILSEAEALLGAQDAACKHQPDKLRTFAGKTCWTAMTTSVGSIATERTLTRIAYMAPDGIYHAIIEGTALSASTDLFSTGFSTGTGCVASPTGETIDVDYLESLLGIGISTSFALYTVGVSAFYVEDLGLQRAFQYDSGITVSIPLLPMISFGFTMEKNTSFVIPPTRIDSGACTAQAVGEQESVFADKSGNALEIIASGLKELSETPSTSYRDLMLAEAARASQPTFAMLASQTGSSPQDGLPAANHADLSEDFLARDGGALCSNCPDTSLDGFLFQLQEAASAGDSGATRDAVEQTFHQYQASTPDATRFAVTQRRGGDAMRYIYLAHEDLAAELRGDAHRYLSSEIVDIDAQVGEPVAIQITAVEIAALLGVSPAAVEGAQLSLDGSPRVDKATFEVKDGSVDVEVTTDSSDPLLMVLEVDLTTAAGPFEQAPSEDWVVRPAMRRIRAKAGPPAAITLTAPIRSTAGNALTLTAFVTDKNYAPVDTELSLRFYDGDDKLLGEAPVVFGSAQLSSEVVASSPVATTATSIRVGRSEEESFPGYSVVGHGFSRRATIYVDGRLLDGTEAAVVSSRELVFSEELHSLSPGAHHLMVENPDGRQSAKLEFTKQ